MLRPAWLGMTAALLAACSESPASPERTASGPAPDLAAAQVVSTSVSTPLNAVWWVPCGNGGAGESVSLTGTMHQTYHITQSSGGAVQVKYQFRPQGVSGTGLITGIKYIGTGVTQEAFSAQAGSNHTFVNSFQMISQGGADNFQVHELVHVTVNANGDVTADIEILRAECR
jgi:hypothetical protein